MCTYCGSGFILLICVQLYKQNRYRDTEIKGYVEGAESSLIWSYTSLLITFLIFNRFSIHKKFWKADTYGFSTIPSNAIYVEGVEGYFDLQNLQHASTYIVFDGMVGKP